MTKKKKEKNTKFQGQQIPSQAQRPWETIRRTFSYFKYSKWIFIISLLCNLGHSLFMVFSNAQLAPIVDSVAVYHDWNAFIYHIIIMGILIVSSAITEYLGFRLSAKLGQRIIFHIRKDLNEKILKLPISYFDSHSSGETMSTFTNDIDVLSQALQENIAMMFTSAITLVGIIIMMIILSWKLTLIVVAFMVFLYICLHLITGRARHYYSLRQANTADLNGFSEEMITSQRVIKLFTHEDEAMDEFNQKSKNLKDASVKAATFGVIAFPLAGNISFMMYAALAIFGSFFVMAGGMSIGDLTAFLQYSRNLTRPLTIISDNLNMIFMALAGAERIFNILDLPEEETEGQVHLVHKKDQNGESRIYWAIPEGVELNEDAETVLAREAACQEDGDSPACQTIPKSAKTELSTPVTDSQPLPPGYRLLPVHGYVRFDHVDFSYVPGHPILKDLSLYAKPGQKIAFVGSTGAGKTTVTNLINAFYSVDSGKITVDGVDIRDINRLQLRSTLSMVLQDVNLFHGTVKENIRLGRLDASDEEVVEAAKMANADFFIRRLEDGYDTEISNDSGALSQGERQLISIARAAVANPVILILDEATSSVDTRTEKLISQGMDALMEGRTTFVIAHRLSTVRDANAIIVLENGEIIERGDHDDLMAAKGRYYQLTVGNEILE